MFDINNILNRARNILFSSSVEWETIKVENTNTKSIFISYLIPFSIGIAIASLLGSLIFASFYSFGFKFLSAIVSSVNPLITIYLSSKIINELTPSFGSKKDFNSVFKLVAYSYTASLVISLLINLLPFLSVLSIFGLYSLYIYWIGMPVMLETSSDKRVGFLIVSALIIMGVSIVISLSLGVLLTPFMINSINI